MATFWQKDDKENLNPQSGKSNISSEDTKRSAILNYNDSAINSTITNFGDSLEITDLSFSAIEQACNKTFSDPDNKMHTYIESIRKDNDTKLTSVSEEVSDTNDAINILLKKLEAEELKYKDYELKELTDRNYARKLEELESQYLEHPRNTNLNSKFKQTFSFSNVTQLNDVEEPSALWEITGLDNSKYQLSPTKMVGLLRPSTILEESSASRFTGSTISENSFNTAQKNDSNQTCSQSDTSSQYETGSELAKVTNQIPGHNKETNNKISQIEDNFPDEEINILQHSFDIEHYTLNQVVHLHELSIKKERSFQQKENAREDSSSTIEISDDETTTRSKNKSCDKSNKHVSAELSKRSLDHSDGNLDITSDNEIFDVSREFNDTVEEVEYIMKHAMKMHELKSSLSKSQHGDKEKSILPANHSKTQHLIFNSKYDAYYENKPQSVEKRYTSKSDRIGIINNLAPSTSPYRKNSPQYINAPRYKTHQSPLNKAPLKQCFGKMISTTSPRKNLVRKPISIDDLNNLPRSLTTMKKSFYADVISPVGAYIRKTPVCPSERKIKDTNVKSLDYGQAIGKANIKYHLPKRVEIKKGKGPSLPQKCYKSAVYKRVNDERTPLNIPGGQKIQKYLTNALKPAVTRHDGKIKIDNSNKSPEFLQPNDLNKSVETDIGDFSTISGNLSLYTIKDAGKFTLDKKYKMKN